MTTKKFMKRNIKMLYVLGSVTTLVGIKTAYEWRGYLAFGGEILIPLIPVMIHIWIVMEE